MPDINWFQRQWVNGWPHRLRLRHYVPRFLKACPEPFRGEVLEIGAGKGWTSRQILDTFPQVELTATDVSFDQEGVLHRLQQQYGRRLKVKEANVLKLPFDRDVFDIAIAINVMPHLQAFGVRRAVQELLRIVRPGGLLGISDHLLFSNTFFSRRVLVEEVLREEQCDLLHTRGGRYYDIWAQKPYPIQPKK